MMKLHTMICFQSCNLAKKSAFINAFKCSSIHVFINYYLTDHFLFSIFICIIHYKNENKQDQKFKSLIDRCDVITAFVKFCNNDTTYETHYARPPKKHTKTKYRYLLS